MVHYPIARKGRSVSKLFKLKEWLTVPDAARYLSIAFGEEVTDADVLRLALDGHLKLSVNFVNHAVARSAKWIPRSQYTELMELERALGQTPQNSEEPVLKYGERAVPIEGIWDLAMIGAEILDVEHQYQLMTGGTPVTLVNIDGTFVVSHDGQIYQLLTHFDDNPYCNSEEQKKSRAKKSLYDPENYFPAGGLPEDAVIVVRTTALREFEQAVNDEPASVEKPMTTTERNTLLTIIAALCDYSDIKHQERGAASKIVKMTEEIGAPVTDDTIRNVFGKIPDALESRK